MKIYILSGVTPGLSEKILSTSKKRAKEITELRKLGGIISVKTLDKKPKLRLAVSQQHEMLEALEWKDMEKNKWHSGFTIDPSLYKKSVREILKNKFK